jgi:hypothetical protein
MHPSQSGEYRLAGDGYVFADDYNNRETPTWYTISTSVPLAQNRHSRSCCVLRASGTSPFFNVRHEVRVTLTCAYDVPETCKPAMERLQFSFPLQFVHVTPTPVSHSTSPPPVLRTSDSSSLISSAEPIPQARMLPCSLPYTHSLPAYSQLFDSNGDRKIDYSHPLPVYTPHSPPSADHLELDARGSRGEKLSLHVVAEDSST